VIGDGATAAPNDELDRRKSLKRFDWMSGMKAVVSALI